jgi:hypothetical protein
VRRQNGSERCRIKGISEVLRIYGVQKEFWSIIFYSIKVTNITGRSMGNIFSLLMILYNQQGMKYTHR